MDRQSYPWEMPFRVLDTALTATAAHRYVFRSYVLDCRLNLLPASRRRTLMKAMSGHILQEASLLGIFRRT